MGIRSILKTFLGILAVIVLYSGCKTKSKLVKTEEQLHVVKSAQVDSSIVTVSSSTLKTAVDTSKKSLEQKLTSITKRTIDITLDLDSGEQLPLDSAGKISVKALLSQSRKLRIRIDEQINTLNEKTESETAAKSSHEQTSSQAAAASNSTKNTSQTDQSKSTLQQKEKQSGTAAGSLNWLSILGLIPILIFAFWLYKNLFKR
ncbi:hypothetical protein [Pedobacter antarcticus]|uniref:hypothetical protein n=1 Tax=Pedobacter antarcticus TaxID=34086 RepID=UPI00087F7E3C|nr:hypothetical protein [Pedobacter antarcticus]SDM40790.1 hypothetical protein SAMN04488084_106177 [Pedobacter antarcticus]